MEITCSSCSTRLNIPDHKIPKDKTASFRCPKCSERIVIQPETEAPPPAKTPSGDPPSGSSSPATDYDADEKPFDYLDDDARTALLCLAERQINPTVKNTLKGMGYHLEEVTDPRTALVRMKYHLFNLILLDESFDQQHKGAAVVLQELRNLSMSLRRRIVVVLVSEKHRSLDHMTAFMRSVNQVVNIKDLQSNAQGILSKVVHDAEAFYKVFNESLKKAGKA